MTRIPTPRNPAEGTTPRKYHSTRRITRSVKAQLAEIAGTQLSEEIMAESGTPKDPVVKLTRLDMSKLEDENITADIDSLKFPQESGDGQTEDQAHSPQKSNDSQTELENNPPTSSIIKDLQMESSEIPSPLVPPSGTPQREYQPSGLLDDAFQKLEDAEKESIAMRNAAAGDAVQNNKDWIAEKPKEPLTKSRAICIVWKLCIKLIWFFLYAVFVVNIARTCEPRLRFPAIEKNAPWVLTTWDHGKDLLLQTFPQVKEWSFIEDEEVEEKVEVPETVEEEVCEEVVSEEIDENEEVKLIVNNVCKKVLVQPPTPEELVKEPVKDIVVDQIVWNHLLQMIEIVKAKIQNTLEIVSDRWAQLVN